MNTFPGAAVVKRLVKIITSAGFLSGVVVCSCLWTEVKYMGKELSYLQMPLRVILAAIVGGGMSLFLRRRIQTCEKIFRRREQSAGVTVWVKDVLWWMACLGGFSAWGILMICIGFGIPWDTQIPREAFGDPAFARYARVLIGLFCGSALLMGTLTFIAQKIPPAPDTRRRGYSSSDGQ